MSSPLEYQSGYVRPPLPAAVVVIALLYIGVGLLAAYNMGWYFAVGRPGLNFNVLGVFVGWGLLRRSSGWRVCAIVLGGLGVLTGLFLAGMAVIHRDRLYFHINREPLDLEPPVALTIALALCAGLILLCIWQCRMLMRPAVKILFLMQWEEDPDEPERRWPWWTSIWLWVGAMVVVFWGGCHVGSTFATAGPANQWQTVTMPRVLQDWRGNIIMLDAKTNAVGIAATGLPGAFPLRMAQNAFLAKVGDPPVECTVLLERNRLNIVLPGTAVQTFRIPPGFAEKLEAFMVEMDVIEGSYLRAVVERMEDPKEKARLEQFLSGYTEPESALRGIAATRPATTRPAPDAP